MATAFSESSRGTEGLLPLMSCRSFFQFSCAATFSSWRSNQRLLLAHVKKLENIAASSRRVLFDKLLRLLARSSAPRSQCPLLNQHFSPGNYLLLPSPFNQRSSKQHAALPGPLATVFHPLKRTSFAATSGARSSHLLKRMNVVAAEHSAFFGACPIA